MASTSTADEFLFPRKFDFKYSPGKDEKVCVVAILGKSAYNSQVSKASPLNQIVDRQVFQGYAGQDLECYYDSESRVVYLHHWSVGDAARLTNLCQTLSAEQDITESLEAEGLQHAKTLLFLFSVSHLVVVNHPGASFDVSYIQLFNTINAIRLKWQPFITELLSDFPLPKDWILSGRPCSPRALFVFSRCLLDSDGRPGNQRGPSVRRLQHAVEDQIYRLLRKSRTITNISNNSLFAVPANQEFVYIHTKGRKLPDPVTTLLTQLRCHCPITQDNDSPRSPSFGIDRHGSLGRGDQSVLAFLEGSTDSSFKEFLEQHTQQALTKGFDDNVGRHPIPALFELCSCDVWFSMATSLYTAMFEEDGRLRSYYSNLGLLLNTDRRFSENRCSKVFPLAESTYQDGLPPHYTESYHQSKLAQARRVFCQHARGPCLGGYLRQLEESCTDWWRNGHQLCEAVSLTGHHCINRLHRVAGDAANSELEEMAHCSQYKTRAACNCGGIQADRPDPFTHRAANYEFYVDLEEQCCGNLDHTDLPVFRPSTSEVRAGESHDTPTVDPQPKGNVDAGTPILDPPSSQAKVDMLTSGLASLSLALSLDQASVDVAHSVESTADGETGGVTLNLQQPAEVSKPLSRQPSTVEYLPGMLNSGSSSGLLPLFPSWSVCGLPNKPSLYSTTQGLNQPGFLPGSNFLLPWDIPVMAEREKWPTVGEGVMRKGKQRRTVKETGDQTVRAYLGVEYECPRSHRFFCSGPEKIIKVSSNSTVKDNANKLLTMDMPLYCPCHCRSSKGLLAQLMRVYVLPPEGPVTLTVNPRVLPNPAPCPVFHPGSGHIQLEPGKIWVIRFPYMYLGPAGVYRIPSDPDQLQQCRLLQGMFEYTDHSEGQAKSG